jgi:catechol 2,3-dioxygenase-like lactoylglutathione lyase family enzyme
MRWGPRCVAEGVAPILPSRDLRATSAFYERLGYEEAGFWPDEYLIVSRGAIGLHFFHCPELDPGSSIAGCYLYVEDADALHTEYSAVGLPGEGIPRLHGAPQDTEYGLREFGLVDADGNLLRIGSQLAQAG